MLIHPCSFTTMITIYVYMDDIINTENNDDQMVDYSPASEIMGTVDEY